MKLDANHVLFVCFGLDNQTEALKQAVTICQNNETQLTALIICPPLPAKMQEYKDSYQNNMIAKLEAEIDATCTNLKIDKTKLDLKVDLISDATAPIITIVKYIVNNDHDFLIKQANLNKNRTYSAIDINLLRQCPCPVWLARPIQNPQKKVRVAVAIDAHNEDNAAKALAVNLLQTGRILANQANKSLDIFTCWDYAFEHELRHNPWVKTEDQEIDQIIRKEENENLSHLETLIETSGISKKYTIHNLRGAPDVLLPDFVENEGVDCVVMGTLARSGIAGFIIGNTSENIMHNVTCSLVVIKPEDFVSPVKI